MCGHVISFSIGGCLACLHNSSFRILHGHQICRMLLRHFLIITCNVCFSSWVNLQVSAYSSFSVVWTAISVSASWTPSSGSQCEPGCPPKFPLLSHYTPRYLNSLPPQFASSQSLHLDPAWNRHGKLVFVALTFKLTFSLCSSKDGSCPAYTVSCYLQLPLLFLVTLGFANDLEMFSCPSVHYVQPTRKNPTYCAEQWWWSLWGQAFHNGATAAITTLC